MNAVVVLVQAVPVVLADVLGHRPDPVQVLPVQQTRRTVKDGPGPGTREVGIGDGTDVGMGHILPLLEFEQRVVPFPEVEQRVRPVRPEDVLAIVEVPGEFAPVPVQQPVVLGLDENVQSVVMLDDHVDEAPSSNSSPRTR